jgi:hypothetical protein
VILIIIENWFKIQGGNILNIENMKKIKIIICYYVCCTLLTVSCKKTGEVYNLENIPPSQVIFNGAEEIFLVPAVSNIAGYYSVDFDNLKLKVTLGMSYNGLSEKEDVNIKVKINLDTATSILSQLGSNYAALPSTYVEIPETLKIPKNSNGINFDLEINLDEISKLISKTQVIALEIETEDSENKILGKNNIRFIHLDMANILGSPTFIDEFNSITNTQKYASLTGNPKFERNSGNFYNDVDWLLKNGDNAVTIIYSVEEINKDLPLAKELLGFRVNALVESLNDINGLVNLYYSNNNGISFLALNSYNKDIIKVPSLGNDFWMDMCFQGELPSGTTHFKIELPIKAEKASWVPLLRRAELFYKGGSQYVYKPLEY